MRGAFVFLVVISVCACGGGTESNPNDGGVDATADVTQTQDAGADVSVFETGVGDGGACGNRTGHRGLTSRTMNGRTYEVYVPQSLDPKKLVPFVVVHHGYTMSGDVMRVIT